MSGDPKTRLNIRINTDLYSFIKEYAKNRGTTVTGVIIEYFCYLRESKRISEEEGNEEFEQDDFLFNPVRKSGGSYLNGSPIFNNGK